MFFDDLTANVVSPSSAVSSWSEPGPVTAAYTLDENAVVKLIVRSPVPVSMMVDALKSEVAVVPEDSIRTQHLQAHGPLTRRSGGG